MSVSTHVLDAVAGRPAAGVRVVLERRDETGWNEIAARSTDTDGRVADLASGADPGVYRLRFDVEGYLGAETFYPEVAVTFRITDAAAHHHVPLLLSPYAYSTYRGS
ncbi:MAG TPA: hydroxyisourate hydrolase [Jatrophihabitans sp.]|uniref:hydroxyisourate hydrolase n=1 Tax=Jatrophihabitans sp. TaxID=1932789 RepID=UPI002DF92F05|nr:hydroxyisourate hydrolase [Jatrophihabitans sp.]